MTASCRRVQPLWHGRQARVLQQVACGPVEALCHHAVSALPSMCSVWLAGAVDRMPRHTLHACTRTSPQVACAAAATGTSWRHTSSQRRAGCTQPGSVSASRRRSAASTWTPGLSPPAGLEAHPRCTLPPWPVHARWWPGQFSQTPSPCPVSPLSATCGAVTPCRAHSAGGARACGSRLGQQSGV